VTELLHLFAGMLGLGTVTVLALVGVAEWQQRRKT